MHDYEHRRKITALRTAKKMSQVDLAKDAGVSREIIGRYERSEVSPSIDIAKKIAETLEVSLDYLAGGSDKVNFDKRTLKLIDGIEELSAHFQLKYFSSINNYVDY